MPCAPRRRTTARARHSRDAGAPPSFDGYIDNLLDGYHQEGVHPRLAAAGSAQQLDVRMLGEVACFEVPGRPRDAAGLWAWMWPTFSLSVHRGALLVESLRPDGPARTRGRAQLPA